MLQERAVDPILKQRYAAATERSLEKADTLKEDVLADDGKATAAENPTASIAKPLTIESVSIAQTEESSSFLTVISLKMRLFGKLLAARLACV